VSELDDLLADLTSGDEDRAEAAVPKLVSLGEAAFPALRALLDSPDTDRRWWALSVLAQNEQVDVDWLLAALDDQAAEVRQCAALGLCAHPAPKSVPALIGALQDPDSMVSTLAANALAAIGEAAVPALLDLVEDASLAASKSVAAQTARLNAMRALAAIADPRAIPAMMAALKEGSTVMQHWAETGLENLGLDMVYLKLD